MTTTIDKKRQRIKECLDNHHFTTLFIEELGWERYNTSIPVEVDGTQYNLAPIAHKRGCVALHCPQIPESSTRAKIETRVSKNIREHIIIFADADAARQRWQWVRRTPGQPLSRKEHEYHSRQPMALIERIGYLEVPVEEEEDTDLVDVLDRVRSALDVERVTKRFYDQFKTKQNAFQELIEGIDDSELQRWYSSVMLNRLMFIYFIQKKGFLNGDTDYLRHRLEQVQELKGKGQFQTFYSYFLMKLCHEALGKHPDNRQLDSDLIELIGDVPYLNGGIFQQHKIERNHPNIDIPDEAFEDIFDFFDGYTWHLDTRPNAKPNEINPDVLGYIFEKYINQKEMGAYYTKEDITEYISKNTIIPRLFDKVEKQCKIAFEGDISIWRHLQEDPDRYIYPAMRHGITYDVHKDEEIDTPVEYPENIAKGLDTEAPNLLERRKDWNTPAPEDAALPTEIWRETIDRHQRYYEVRNALENLTPASETETSSSNPGRGINPLQPRGDDGDERSAKCANSTDLHASQNSNEGVQGESSTPPARGSGGEKPPQFSINDLITYNCDVRQFIQDVIERCESPDLLNAIWVAIAGRLPQKSNQDIKYGITVLDPTCGSGAFLFAALNVLEPLYEACLDRMEGFLDEWGENPAHKNYAQFFQSIIDDINNHPSRKYYIYKSIIVNNLYGVDIMKEAVEICQLRLFLKLIAQVTPDSNKHNMGVEPLPDIDFNIRSGNTLVGFASKEQMEEAMKDDLLAYSTVLPEIMEKADECDDLFQLFRRAQLENDPSAPQAKKELSEKLAEVDTRLNYYLAEQYGVDNDKPQNYQAFLDSHQPFHWFIEFYGIMKNGGFDVAIGNPPYVTYSPKKLGYTVSNFLTTDCGDLFALVTERAVRLLCGHGFSGLIVRLSSAANPSMTKFRNLLHYSTSNVWASFYSASAQPACLFEGVRDRLSIYLCRKGTSLESFFSTKFLKWFTWERPYLFTAKISYVLNTESTLEYWPKLGGRLSDNIFRKIIRNPSLENFVIDKGDAKIYYHESPVHWHKAWVYVPYYWNELKGRVKSVSIREFTFRSHTDRNLFLPVANSSLLYWFVNVVSDCRHLTSSTYFRFCFQPKKLSFTESEQLIQLGDLLMQSYEKNKRRYRRKSKKTGMSEFDAYYPVQSKEIIDQIDAILASVYSFNPEELDFIINYDIKYRMGDELFENSET